MTADPETADLRRLVSYGLVSGLCNLIPVPLLDDWARDLLRKRQAMELAERHGVQLSGAEGKALGCGHHPPSAEGCVRGCLLSVLIQPIQLLFRVVFKKTVRKILFFLIVKDVIDTFSRTFNEGYLLRHALALGALPSLPEAVSPAAAPGEGSAPEPARGPSPRILSLRATIEETLGEVDTQPIRGVARGTLQGSWRVLRRAGRAMSKQLRRLWRRDQPDERKIYERLEHEGEEGLGGLINEMTASLAGQEAYLEDLETRLEGKLGILEVRDPQPPPVPPAPPPADVRPPGR